jgi:hypothetical protein
MCGEGRAIPGLAMRSPYPICDYCGRDAPTIEPLPRYRQQTIHGPIDRPLHEECAAHLRHQHGDAFLTSLNADGG